MINRRRFLQTGAAAAAVLAWPRRAYPFAQSPTGVSKFTVPLPGLGPKGIPVLTPNKTKFPGTDYYEIEAAQFTQQLHPQIPETTFWGYADAASKNHRYLGGVIVAQRGTPVKLKVTNRMPETSILPVDATLADPTTNRTDRIAVHLHGGLVFWNSDGGPFAWFSNANNTGGFVHGSSFINGGGPGRQSTTIPTTRAHASSGITTTPMVSHGPTHILASPQPI